MIKASLARVFALIALADIPGMSGAHDLRQDDPEASLNRYEFLARAWRIANAKARELGWIVCESARAENG
jgi:hypothetical protein